METEWHGGSCRRSEPSARVIATHEEWDRLWESDLGLKAPPADFERYFAAAVFLGLRNTGGWNVEFLEPMIQTGETVIRYRACAPPRTRFVTQAFTRPYAVRLYPRTGSKVSLSETPC